MHGYVTFDVLIWENQFWILLYEVGEEKIFSIYLQCKTKSVGGSLLIWSYFFLNIDSIIYRYSFVDDNSFLNSSYFCRQSLISPDSHWCPVNPSAHWHVYSLNPSKHVPPFWHVTPMQSSISKDEIWKDGITQKKHTCIVSLGPQALFFPFSAYYISYCFQHNYAFSNLDKWHILVTHDPNLSGLNPYYTFGQH